MVTDALKKTGQFENTLIIFLSDNGGKPSQGASNAPLRGTKGDAWEGGFRVPMFFHWPNHIPARKFDYPVTSLDFYPTFAKLAGATVPKGKKLDGKDIMTDLINGTNPRKGEMIYCMRHQGAYTDVGARRDNWKVTRHDNQPWRLFSIDEDPGESNDLAAQYPERVEQMVKEAEAWSRSHAEPLWFHAEPARDQWKKNGMPHFDNTFSPDLGAPALSPVIHITDQAAAAAPLGVKLKKGDATKEQFMVNQKANAEKKGIPFDARKAEKMFQQLDANGDGIAAGEEKKAYYGTGTSKPSPAPKSVPPAKPAKKKAKGDSTKEEFVAREKAKWEKNGWPWDQSKVEANFDKMDTNNDGLISGQEKKAYWSK